MYISADGPVNVYNNIIFGTGGDDFPSIFPWTAAPARPNSSTTISIVPQRAYLIQ